MGRILGICLVLVLALNLSLAEESNVGTRAGSNENGTQITDEEVINLEDDITPEKISETKKAPETIDSEQIPDRKIAPEIKAVPETAPKIRMIPNTVIGTEAEAEAEAEAETETMIKVNEIKETETKTKTEENRDKEEIRRQNEEFINSDKDDIILEP